jgi:hypothetical protein
MCRESLLRLMKLLTFIVYYVYELDILLLSVLKTNFTLFIRLFYILWDVSII